jgi:hypothetical protein
MPENERELSLEAIRTLIKEAHLVLTTIERPEGGAKRAAKLLDSALALTDDLIAHPSSPVSRAQSDGKKTAERGPEYSRQIPAQRKTHTGGRPRK